MGSGLADLSGQSERRRYTDFFLYDPVRGFWIQALNNGGDGTFTYTLGNWDSSWTVVPSDLDGDGLTDMFVYNFATGVWVKCFVGWQRRVQGLRRRELGSGLDVLHGGPERRRPRRLLPLQPDQRRLGRGVQSGGLRRLRLPGVGAVGSGLAGDPADLNGDGRTDLFLLNAAGVHVSALSLRRRRLRLRRRAAVGRRAGRSLPGDLNSDGRTDLFLYNPTTGVWVEAFSDGVGGFTSRRLGQLGSGLDGGDDRLQRGRPRRPAPVAPDGMWVQATNTGDGTFAYTAGNWGTGWTVFTNRPSDR